MAQIYSYFKLEAVSINFVSHALAFQADDSHLQRPALPIVMNIKNYARSMLRFKGSTSPFLYPSYGLGGIAESFSRLASIYGSTFITDCDVKSLNYGEDGKFTGITFNQAQCGEVTATAPQIIGDPSYFGPEASRVTNQICRSICILSAPIRGAANDGQIILPGKNIGKASDVYVSMLSGNQKVCPQGIYLAVMSTVNNGRTLDASDKKSATAACQREMKVAYGLCGNTILDRFDWVSEERVSVNEAADIANGVHMTQSFDAATHFQAMMNEIFKVYKNVTGNSLDADSLRSTKEMQQEAMEAAMKEAAAAEAAANAAAAE
jgi:Rab GDP dissociation inhibitor